MTGLEVTVSEVIRRFRVKVGDLNVGRIEVYGPASTDCLAFTKTNPLANKYNEHDSLYVCGEWHDTLKAATNAILVYQGFGAMKSKDRPTVSRITGVRA